ncbi:MAG: LysR family transcriptional regulator [Hyphomicrobiales bacterium]|nr:LysR family transcriptional regulator [Hyphomicrobiales bacterium]
MTGRSVDWDSRIGRRVRLRDMHILLTVVQRGSMAKAAAHLGISQPAVSEAIASLEDALGARLLDRSRRGIEPTACGAALAQRSRAAFDELRQGIKEIESLTDPATGEVRIACPESIAAGFLPPVLELLSQKYPRLTLHVLQANTPTVEFPELQARDVDLFLARLARPPSQGTLRKNLKVEVLFNDRLCLAVGVQSPWANRRKISLAELVHEPWIMTPLDAPGGLSFLDLFRQHGLEPPRVFVTTFSIHLRNRLAAAGRFITALPESVMRLPAEQTLLRTLPIALPVPHWPVAIVTLANRSMNPAVGLFMECARDVARSVSAAPRS